MIGRGQGRHRHVPAPPELRPGWVYEVVLAVLATANLPLRPRDVIQLADRLHGDPIAPSSVRNCLRTVSGARMARSSASRTARTDSVAFALNNDHSGPWPVSG